MCGISPSAPHSSVSAQREAGDQFSRPARAAVITQLTRASFNKDRPAPAPSSPESPVLGQLATISESPVLGWSARHHLRVPGAGGGQLATISESPVLEWSARHHLSLGNMTECIQASTRARGKNDLYIVLLRIGGGQESGKCIPRSMRLFFWASEIICRHVRNFCSLKKQNDNLYTVQLNISFSYFMNNWSLLGLLGFLGHSGIIRSPLP